MREEWRKTEFPLYEVSNLGRVRSWRNEAGNTRTEPRILKPWQSGRMYKSGKRGSMQIMICTDSGNVKRKIHHLVLEAFEGPCPEGCEAAHLDGDITNNRINNLDWVTHIENEKHKRIHGTLLRGENATGVKLTKVEVKEIREMAAKGVTHAQIAREFKVTRRTVSNIINRVSWKHI